MRRICLIRQIPLFASIALLAGCAENLGSPVLTDRAGPYEGPTSPPLEATTGSMESAGGTTTRPNGEPANLLDSTPGSIGARDRGVIRVAALLDILRVEVPLGTVSDSQKVWGHLNEQAVAATRQVTLKQNGLRVGVGRPESWGPIKAILDGIKDTLVYHETASLNTGVLTLWVNDAPDDQTVFWFRSDGTMAGETFPRSCNLFQIMYRFNSEDPSKLALKVLPEIRQDQRKMEWARKDGRYRRVPVYNGRIWQELSIEVSLTSKWFLVIGPGKEIDVSVVGRSLLTRNVDGRRYESIFFLTPRIVRSGLESP